MTDFLLRDWAVRAVHLPLASPFRTSRGTVATRDVLVVRARLDVGGAVWEGVGEAAPLPGWSRASFAATRDALDAVSEACDAGWSVDSLVEAVPPQYPEARFAVEVALLDAVSRAKDMPLATYLAPRAGASRPAIGVNATLGALDPRQAAARAAELRDRGFDCLKIKIAADPLEVDVARVARVREAVGEDVTIRLDANGRWSQAEALGALSALAPFDIAYVEQPVAADDLQALARVAAASPVPIAADEAASSLQSAMGLVDARAVDVLVLKPALLGGLKPTLRVADHAYASGMRVTLTSFLDSAISRTAVAHAAASRPWLLGPHGLATGSIFQADLVDRPDAIDRGRWRLPTGMGLGRRWNFWR